VPSSLVSGQIAINEADGKLFYRNGSGAVTQLATGGGTELFAYANTASFPGTGSTTALYLSISSGRLFQWNGSVYAEVGPVGGSGSIFTAATVAGFPAIGSSAGVIYLATDTARTYMWQGAYIELGVSGGGGTDTELRALLTPPAPTSVTPTAGNAQVSLAWTAPTVLSVTPITDYTVQFSSNSGSTWTTFTRAASTATSGVVVTSLTNGTPYVFRVSATNAIGTGSYSAASSAVTPNSASVPDAPTSLRNADNYWGCSTNSTMWNAPASNGGSVITGYVWRIGSGATTSVAPSSGSRPAGSYTGGFVSSHAPTGSFQVAAVNAVGTGPFASFTLQQDCN
jgi:titin